MFLWIFLWRIITGCMYVEWRRWPLAVILGFFYHTVGYMLGMMVHQTHKYDSNIYRCIGTLNRTPIARIMWNIYSKDMTEIIFVFFSSPFNQIVSFFKCNSQLSQWLSPCTIERNEVQFFLLSRKGMSIFKC